MPIEKPTANALPFPPKLVLAVQVPWEIVPKGATTTLRMTIQMKRRFFVFMNCGYLNTAMIWAEEIVGTAHKKNKIIARNKCIQCINFLCAGQLAGSPPAINKIKRSRAGKNAAARRISFFIMFLPFRDFVGCLVVTHSIFGAVGITDPLKLS